MSTLCRDCLTVLRETAGKPARRCPACHSPRLVAHPELESLSIAHIDCDAFYASVEKRERPELRDKPVIVGGGRRGVVSAACYVARLSGVHSAMPMFKALEACPNAVVLRPDMAKYRRVGRRIREMMESTTPLVEPLSIDEAFLDLAGTERLHGGPPARTLADLALRIERELGLTVSIGLAANKFLAKIASDLDKPRGFAVIGRAEAPDFLAAKPVGIIWGVGKAMQRALARDGIRRVGDLRALDEAELVARYGAMGRRLHRFCRGEDTRPVELDSPAKSLSAETTFESDIADAERLLAALWPLSETVAGRLKRSGLAGSAVTLKLKTADFRLITRSRRLGDPTCLAERVYRAGEDLLRHEADGRRFRLIGIGVHELVDAGFADPPDWLDPERERQARVERLVDAVRGKLGEQAIGKGRGFVATASKGPSNAGPKRR
ncbi:MAG TPA: DNA polymerase IV [Kiloniellales bacterium]|nr:DNA polymerase IV [Kiloniellales bacterium]